MRSASGLPAARYSRYSAYRSAHEARIPPNTQRQTARRDRLTVKIHLMDGRHLEARIKNFDKFAVVVEAGGQDQLIFKHAIATIETPRAVANYLSPHS